MNRNILFALEDVEGEVTDGKAADEVEHVFYGQINDVGAKALAELAKQPFVKKALQEQYQVKLDLKANNDKMTSNLRVRKVNTDGYVLTNKKRMEGANGCVERSLEIDAQMFEFFKYVAGEGLIKMRYTIQPENWPHALELDVFLDATGVPTGFAKYDFEVPANGKDIAVPSLPVTLFNLKHLNPFNCDERDAAMLREFMAAQQVTVVGEFTPPAESQPDDAPAGAPDAPSQPSEPGEGGPKPTEPSKVDPDAQAA